VPQPDQPAEHQHPHCRGSRSNTSSLKSTRSTSTRRSG
jgi:hypothetical protein